MNRGRNEYNANKPMDDDNNYTNTFPSVRRRFLPFDYLMRSKRSLLALLSLFLLFLLVYNGATIFCVHVPFPAKAPPEPASLLPKSAAGDSRNRQSSSPKLSSPVMHAVQEESPPVGKTHLLPFNNSRSLVLSMTKSSIYMPKQRRKRRPLFKILRLEARKKKFSARVKEFFGEKASNSSCQVRFFMTWISSLESFGDRELFAIQSLFNSHPNGCLIIVSDSMDSDGGRKVLIPFLNRGFRVTSISPDFNYLFKSTVAEAWFDQLRKGNVDPGEVSLGQNVSNLLRLALLYKFGGVYIDTDVIVLKSFEKLRNTIGAQTVDAETGKWTRLNNAVMIFDKGHPLLYKFIQEFALTFNGNKWGHNGPYMVSRVVTRVQGRPEFDFNVLPPVAFYPVGWSRIGSLFRGPMDEAHSKWLLAKLRHIRSQSFAVHLWNRQSRKLKVEEGSVIGHIMSVFCVFCNSSTPTM